MEFITKNNLTMGGCGTCGDCGSCGGDDKKCPDCGENPCICGGGDKKDK